MRATLLGLALMGCGTVHIGNESPSGELDAQAGTKQDAGRDASRSSDTAAEVPPPIAFVTVNWPAICGDCADLLVEGSGGKAPYNVEWSDGETQAERRICGDDLERPLMVVVTDAKGARSAPHITKLTIGDASCPVDAGTPRLRLENPSFEGTPQANTGVPPTFDGAPWSDCSNPSFANTPVIGNETLQPINMETIPHASNGLTWVGLQEDEQASQALSQGVPAGTSLSFRIDLRSLNVGPNGLPNTEASFLEVWGGLAVGCTKHEPLWTSPKLGSVWNTYCATVRPKQAFDRLVLISQSDKSLPTATYLLADNIVPVESCPTTP